MRLVATEYLSMDGVFEEPGHWSMPYFGEEAGRFKWDELMAADALLLGRRTYEGFAAAWPTMPDTGEFGVRMNSIPKYVVSSSLDKADWSGSELVKGDLGEEIRRLKEKPGGDLLLSGSGTLFLGLMDLDLIDLYRFMVHPVVLGKGRRLFAGETGRRDLDLADVRRFGSGIVVLEFTPKPGG